MKSLSARFPINSPFRSQAMHEYKPIQFDDLAHVLHNAHMRRSADFGVWLRQYLRDRRQAGWHKEAKVDLLNAMISLIAPSARQSN
jgi:hypothetical protein